MTGLNTQAGAMGQAVGCKSCRWLHGGRCGAFDYRGGYSFGGIHVWCILTSAMAFNGMLHLLGTIQTRQYSPGVVTGMAVYVPLLAVSVAYFVGTRAMILPTAILCVVLGCVLQPVLNYRHERALSREQHS